MFNIENQYQQNSVQEEKFYPSWEEAEKYYREQAKSYLALDLGTKTGWAVKSNGKILSGSRDFKETRFSGGGMR